MGLNIGADDYVTKPFTPLELLARVNSQLRRYRKFIGELNKKEETANIHVIGGLEINEDTMEVTESFVELQKGSFKAETEADLFKAEIRWNL